jgi:hypothetical protein
LPPARRRARPVRRRSHILSVVAENPGGQPVEQIAGPVDRGRQLANLASQLREARGQLQMVLRFPRVQHRETFGVLGELQQRDGGRVRMR